MKTNLRINELENIVFNHPLFLKLKPELQKRVKGRKPARLFTWWSLLEQADLNTDIFKLAWSLYSNYAHSEYLSQMQIRESLSNIEYAKEKCNLILNIMFCLTSVFLRDFIKLFPETKQRYNSLDKNTLEVIDIFNFYGRKVEE